MGEYQDLRALSPTAGQSPRRGQCIGEIRDGGGQLCILPLYRSSAVTLLRALPENIPFPKCLLSLPPKSFSSLLLKMSGDIRENRQHSDGDVFRACAVADAFQAVKVVIVFQAAFILAISVFMEFFPFFR